MYPALTVWQKLATEDVFSPGHENGLSELAVSLSGEAEFRFLWVGSEAGMEADLVKRAGVPYREIPAAGVHGVGARALPGNLLRLGRGYLQSVRILREFRPDALMFTGGYVAVPMALAGSKIPALLYVPDIEPGLALKTLARFADCIAVTAEESRAYYSKHRRVVVTGYPTRPELKAWSMDQAREALGLKADLPTLLVFGGSSGARSINRALLAVLPELLAEMQVIHISGRLDWPEVEAAQAGLADRPGDTSHADRYHPYPYLYEEMGAALTAADLVLSRAGASSLGEFPMFGLPALLVPYPHAWQYQQVNARYLAQRGAAQIIQDAELPEQLLPLVRGLMHDHARREAMRQAMTALACPDAARSIARLWLGLAARQDRERIFDL